MRRKKKAPSFLEERHMLRNLLGFRDVRVDDVMVPRVDISAIDLATFGDDVLASLSKADIRACRFIAKRSTVRSACCI